MAEQEYAGKPLSSYDLWELTTIEKSLNDALDKREKARQHPKFDKMKFPDPNPEFLKLKTAIEEEIRKRNNA